MTRGASARHAVFQKDQAVSRMRSNKARLKAMLSGPDWEQDLAEFAGLATTKKDRAGHDHRGKELVGPLISLLPNGDELSGRAAVGLGLCVARISRDSPEEARIIMRRLMWHMNEESGNLGWGIPESMAEIMARSPLLCKEFAHVLLSYIWDTGGEDNFVDYAPLRRSCYLAVERLLHDLQDPELKSRAQKLLQNRTDQL